MPLAPRPELLALLSDVKQNPDDLTPWLVLCDWLEDQEDEADRARGEYCRLCFDKLGRKTYASDWEKGERRRHLFRTHHERWLGPLSLLRPQIQKGLLTLWSHDWIEYLEALEAHPEMWAWVGTLKISHDFPELLSPAIGVGWSLAGLRMLELDPHPGMSDREVGVLASCRAIGSVRELRIRLPELKSNLAHCLVESPHLAGLQRLRIDCWRRQEDETKSRERTEAIGRLQARFGERLRIVESNMFMDDDLE